MRFTTATWTLVAMLSLGAAVACSAPGDGKNSSGPTGSAGALTKDAAIADMLPAAITSAGKVRVASGVSFPPMEFYDANNKVVGFDADLGKALSEVLGVRFDFQNTNFDGIIGGLDAGRYDLSLTSMIDKVVRQEKVDFVDYLKSGVAVMVRKGNPAGITGPDDLCGKSAAVEKSSTGDLSVDDFSKACKHAGKPAVNKQAFPDQATAVQAVQSKRADSAVALDLTLAYNIKQNPEAFEFAGEPVGSLPIGVVIPKSNPKLRDAVQAALKKVIDSGVYDQLLAKWNLQAQALKGAPLNTGT